MGPEGQPSRRLTRSCLLLVGCSAMLQALLALSLLADAVFSTSRIPPCLVHVRSEIPPDCRDGGLERLPTKVQQVGLGKQRILKASGLARLEQMAMASQMCLSRASQHHVKRLHAVFGGSVFGCQMSFDVVVWFGLAHSRSDPATSPPIVINLLQLTLHKL